MKQLNAKISVLGLYRSDKTLFDVFHLPGRVRLDVIVDEIISETMDLETIYHNPESFKVVLDAWSAHRVESWRRLDEVFRIEYDPIENYNRYEDWKDDRKDNSEAYMAGSSNGESLRIGKKAGFDSNSPKTANSDSVEDSEKTKQNSQGSFKSKSNHSGHVHGNIGVTTSQQMIQSEKELRMDSDIYRIIVAEFIEKFCVLVY